jgi:excisionase family DNA binding protein
MGGDLRGGFPPFLLSVNTDVGRPALSYMFALRHFYGLRSDWQMSDAKRTLPRHTLLTTGMIAETCGVDRTTVLRWINQGLLKALTTPGGHRRVRLEDFREFVRSRSWEVLLEESE